MNTTYYNKRKAVTEEPHVTSRHFRHHESHQNLNSSNTIENNNCLYDFPRSNTSNTSSKRCPTSMIPFNESSHGRKRREQRNIGIRCLQAAMKYGIRTPGHHRKHNGNPTSCYIYRGVKYFVDDVTNKEITSFTIPTQLMYYPISEIDKLNHEYAMTNVQIQRNSNSNVSSSVSSITTCSDDNACSTGSSSWKSHTILLVDKSGSMKNSDVKDAKSRYHAVWIAIAQDFIAQRIQTGQVDVINDVVSIILVGDEPQILVECVPTDWILYNKIVDMYYGKRTATTTATTTPINNKPSLLSCSTPSSNDSSNNRNIFKMNYNTSHCKPSGHGNFLPAIQLANEMLLRTSNHSSCCAVTLAILSDGRPSDFSGAFDKAKEHILKTTESMASQFGRRFSIFTIGIGSAMEFNQFEILQDIVTSAKDYGCTQSEFQVPSMSSSSLGAVFSSLATSVTATKTLLGTDAKNNFAVGTTNQQQQQKKMRHVFREKASTLPLITKVVDTDNFHIYPANKVHHMEYDRCDKMFKSVSLQNENAAGVAVKKKAFGEGAERLAFQFFEIKADGHTVVGEPLVAKLSRFIEETDDEFGRSTKWKERDKFVKKFCERQDKAMVIANEFNKKIDSIKTLHPNTARVSFLKCSVYYVDDDDNDNNSQGCGESALLVERKLNGKFQKWNSNNGYVRRHTEFLATDNSITKTSSSNNRKLHPFATMPTLHENGGGIGNADVNKQQRSGFVDTDNLIYVSPSNVAQAFSHFSFTHSGEKMLLVDLQGEYDKEKHMFCFTDPVLHYYNRQNPSKRNIYGRTDMGRKGVEKFFETHECNLLCTLVNRGFRKANMINHNHDHDDHHNSNKRQRKELSI